MCESEKRVREREKKKLFSLIFKIYRNRTVGLKVKLIHISQATHEYQNLRVLSNFTRYRIFLLGLFLT